MCLPTQPRPPAAESGNFLRAVHRTWLGDESGDLAAILKADFMEDVVGGKADLEQYMQDAPKRHHMRQAADDKRKELGL